MHNLPLSQGTRVTPSGSDGGTVGSRRRPISAGWLAGCMLGRYSDVAGVSLSDWPCVFNNVGRWP